MCKAYSGTVKTWSDVGLAGGRITETLSNVLAYSFGLDPEKMSDMRDGRIRGGSDVGVSLYIN